MSLVEVKEPLVFVNEELCWFVLKSSSNSNHHDFHIIFTNLTDIVLQALKGFFLLLKKCSKANKTRTEAKSVCLTIDFSTVTNEKRVDVYKSLLKIIGTEVTELRLSGMDDSEYTNNVIHPFSVSNPILLSTLNLPSLHTIRISNLGGQENIMWLSYFLNAAKNLKQLHIGPLDDGYFQRLGKVEFERYYSRSSSANFASKNEIRAEQLNFLGQCVNFEEMSHAQLFIKGLCISAFSPRSSKYAWKNWEEKGQLEKGIGIPIPIKIQVTDTGKSDDSSVNILCKSRSLVALSGLGYFTLDPKLSSPFHALVKLEVKSGPTWLLDNLENFPSLKHLIWQPNWITETQYYDDYERECYQDYYYHNIDEDVGFGQHPSNHGIRQQNHQANTVEELRPEIVQSHKNLEIFRIVQDWKTCKSLPMNAFQVIQLYSSSFPSLKIFSCEVNENHHVAAFVEQFPQVKEFHFNKYVPITEGRTEKAPQVDHRTGRVVQYHASQAAEISYKLENFRQTVTSFKSQVEKFQNSSCKDKTRTIKIGAFICSESAESCERIELNVPEICWSISNLSLSEIIIPVQDHEEAEQILEAIISSEPKDLKHVHFQIMKLNSSSDCYTGISQQVIDSYKPFFLVTNDFEPGQNTLNCSSLAKDFWE